MAALNTDTFRKSAPLFSTTLNGAISNASTSIVLQSIAGLPTDTGISLVIDPVTATQTNAALQETVVGVISAGTVSLINALRGVEGTAQSHASGAAVYAYLTGTDWNALMAAILNDHVQGGYHNALHDINSKLWLDQTAAANAVNNALLANAATGGMPVLSAEGSDTNIDFYIRGKGTGVGHAENPDLISNFIVSGTGVVAQSSGLVGTFANITFYYAARRYIFTGIANHTYSINQDTYVDINTSGAVTYSGVANGAAAPSLAANSIRVAKVVTNGSAITSVTQTGLDSSLNLIYPAGGIGRNNISYSDLNWYAFKTGNTTTTIPGSFTFTALNGGLTCSFPAVAGGVYEIELSATYFVTNTSMEAHIACQIGGGNAVDAIATVGTNGMPITAREIYTANANGNLTVTCGVLGGVSGTIRTDNYMVTVRRIA